MAGTSELYQSVILDHNRAPRNFRVMEAADRRVEGYNPLCGDQLTLWLKLDDDRITDVSFQGAGCAISTSSASLMTTLIKGKTRAESLALFEQFHLLVTGRLGAEAPGAPLGKLAVFAGVSSFPVRVKCASLCWHTLKSALEQADVRVSTE